MGKIERLENIVRGISGMSARDFAIAKPFWREKDYKKGEFYNEYKNVCKYLGFVLSGVFRIYKYHEPTGVERNMLFFTNNQFMSSFKSFLSQTSCEYYTESVTDTEILYIHYDNLQYLYSTSPAWERFGRIFAESALHLIMHNTEGFLFKPRKTGTWKCLSSTPRSSGPYRFIISLPIWELKGHLISPVQQPQQHCKTL